MKTYTVYEHLFPNGKRYIGITSTLCEKRWRKGEGYKTQIKMYRAINKYGWKNIQHNIIAENLNKKQAEDIERYLISALNTIDNGYNVSIGGENINTTYLNKYVLSMIRYAKKTNITTTLKDKNGHELEIVNFVDGDRHNESASGLWNDAAQAVTKKHKKYSATLFGDVAEFWWYMAQYYDLWLMMQCGMDVSDWEEKLFEQRFAENI